MFPANLPTSRWPKIEATIGSTFCTKGNTTAILMADTQSVSHDDVVVCVCGGKEYKARDAIDAALFRGEVQLPWTEFLRRVKAEKRAEELELEFDDDAIAEAAESFRYQHDLITAEETEQWLAARGLTLDDFSDYLARQYWHGMLDGEIETEDVDFTSAPPELRELFNLELLLSGELNRLTTQLMWRLAALASNTKEDPEAIAAERQKFFNRTRIGAAELRDWWNRIGRHDQWFDEMLATEAAYCQRCEALLDPQARKKELAMLRIPLTRLEAEVIELESPDAAREALFCIREDGMSMEEVAAEGRYPYRRTAFLQENVPSELQQKFLSVAVGYVLDPLARGDGFELYRITRKVEPQLDDPAVQQRIDQRLVARHFSELTSKYVEPRLPAFVSVE
jgi:hypothetical protein